LDKQDKSFTPLKDIIENLLNHGGLPFDPSDGDIWKVWDEVVGPGISSNAGPSWIRNGRLRVTVSDPIWLQELKFVQNDIKEKLNDKLGRVAVKNIEFRVGPR